MPAGESDPNQSGAWLKTHPRVRDKLDVLSVSAEWAIGRLWLYCAGAGNNGRFHVDELPAALARKISPAAANKALAELARHTFLRGDGQGGTTESPQWLSIADDHIVLPDWWRTANPPSETWNDDTLRWRWTRNKRLSRMGELTERIKHRDRNLCRYCGIRVKWGDQKSPIGGTFDHVDPDEDNTFSNVVVACRQHNGRKRDRTPDQWIEDDPDGGLSLLRPGTTADVAAAQRASSQRAGPNLDSTGVEPGLNLAARTPASPTRVEPGSNRLAPATGLASPRTRSRGLHPSPTGKRSDEGVA